MEFAAGERERTAGLWCLVNARCGVNACLGSRKAGRLGRRAPAGTGARPRGALSGEDMTCLEIRKSLEEMTFDLALKE